MKSLRKVPSFFIGIYRILNFTVKKVKKLLLLEADVRKRAEAALQSFDKWKKNRAVTSPFTAS